MFVTIGCTACFQIDGKNAANNKIATLHAPERIGESYLVVAYCIRIACTPARTQDIKQNLRLRGLGCRAWDYCVAAGCQVRMCTSKLRP
jgi:hypothetical protein